MGGGLGESKVRTSRRDEADTQEPGVGTGREGGKPAPCQVLFVRAEQQEVGALPRDLICNMSAGRAAPTKLWLPGAGESPGPSCTGDAQPWHSLRLQIV